MGECVITLVVCNFQGLLFQIRSWRYRRRQFAKVHTKLGEEKMGETGFLLRQRGGGYVDAFRSPNRRRMASVRAYSILMRIIN